MTDERQVAERAARAVPEVTEAAALRGKPSRLTFAVVARTEGGKWIASDQRETYDLVFDANTMADIEERFDGIDEWQKSLESKPIATVRNTLALALERDPRQVGASMLAEEMENYAAGLMFAFGVANGADPTVVESAIAKQLARRRAALTNSLDDESE